MTKHATDTPELLIEQMGRDARAASAIVSQVPTAQKAQALRNAANAMRAQKADIIAANALDMERGLANGLTEAMLDRLKIDDARLEAIASGLEAVASLPDPVGQKLDSATRPNGLLLERVRVPLGVIGIIYESRPNVTADAGALALMSGNAAILRGGSEARDTSRAIHAALVSGIQAAGLPEKVIQLVPTIDRAAVGAMLRADELIDIIIPRGGKSLVARVQEEARVPVLAHLDGICHTFIDRDADAEQALSLTLNAKMRRTGICGATETLLIDRNFDDPKPILSALIDKGCELRGTAEIQALDSRVKPVSDEDWDTEYLDSILAVRLVDDANDAINHIARHGSHHTDAIVTENANTATEFLNRVDSAIVMWNASTQFADGGEFGLGAEIGISTGRMHARGPVALEGLTTYKWIVRGTGQTRP